MMAGLIYKRTMTPLTYKGTFHTPFNIHKLKVKIGDMIIYKTTDWIWVYIRIRGGWDISVEENRD